MKRKRVLFEDIPYEEFLRDLEIIYSKKMEHDPHEKKRAHLLSMTEVAEYFQVSKKTIYNWSRHSILQRIEIGNRIFFEEEGIQKLLKKNKVTGTNKFGGE